MTVVPLYDEFSTDYDRFVDWEARLSSELPCFEGLFARYGVHRVLDVACGTGHHAIALAQRGYDAVGVDLSEPMIEQARKNAIRAQLDVVFVVAGFGELAEKISGKFDAIICLGNSLPHLLSREQLHQALSDMAVMLRQGGVLILQNRNYDRILAEEQRFMPLEARAESDREWLFLRVLDFGPPEHDGLPGLTFHMLTVHRQRGQWACNVRSAKQRPILSAELANILPRVGFGETNFYGDYCLTPYHPQRSTDLIVVARRGQGSRR